MIELQRTREKGVEHGNKKSDFLLICPLSGAFLFGSCRGTLLRVSPPPSRKLDISCMFIGYSFFTGHPFESDQFSNLNRMKIASPC